MRKGFVAYLQCFSDVLGSHHHTEDELVFPCFQKKIPEAPYELLTEQHKIFNITIKEINEAATRICNSEYEEMASLNLASHLSELQKLWIEHVGIEED
jgi:hemerythrin-like domain-containing protein